MTVSPRSSRHLPSSKSAWSQPWQSLNSSGGTAEKLDLDWVYPLLAEKNRGTSMLGLTRIGFTETSEVVKRVPVKYGVETHTETSTYSIFGGCDLTLQPQADPKSSQRAEIL